MTFDEYQQKALTTALFSDDNLKDLAHWALGVTGEAGEIAEKVKKVIRDKDGVIDDETRDELIKEIGDVLWYLAVFAKHLDCSLEEVAGRNAAKLQDRLNRQALRGSGDNR